MRFVDSHAHIAGPEFDSDRGEVIDRARTAGATAIVAIGESIAAAARAREVAAAHPGFVYFTAGVHPHDAASFDPVNDPASIRTAIEQGAVAVGECGLDYHYDHSPRPLQRRAFAAQLGIAAEMRIPVVVHTREAEDDTIAMVHEAGRSNIGGVLHCFTGSHALACAALESGWYISFSGIVTFKKWADDELLRLVPDDRLLVESDSPYLAPVPDRGKRNEPAWVARTVERIATARGATPETVGELSVSNAIRFFSLNAA
jgi:TatD DNase family protein